jgi:myo-inositol-1(or 4)-monophosphatase
MMTSDFAAELHHAIEAAKRGAAELERWRGHFRIREKSRADLVTDADTASQNAIKTYLLNQFPTHGFLGEEESTGKTLQSMNPPLGHAPMWIVDPLDGTGNYAHDVPCYAVNIGLLVEREIVVAVTYDPRLNELFTARKGGGAFLNGERIHVSQVAELRDGLLSTGFPSNYHQQIRNLAVWAKVSEQAQALRRTGSTAINLAYVAAGRFDGYWCYDNWPWDVVPGALLVLEAGGTITSSDGTPFDPFRMDLIATNGRFHQELRTLLNT